MKKITFISTIHKEFGKCNAEELQRILNKISPEVIFLEALESTYSKYERMTFSSFGVLHQKLEIQAIQKFSFQRSFEYLPVLDVGLSEEFEKKYNQVCQNPELQRHLDNFNSMASKFGFTFLNSKEAIELQDELRKFEENLFNNPEKQKIVDGHIDDYENNMIKNIYAFCVENHFDKAVFMCGVAHRNSIIQKIRKDKRMMELGIEWSFPNSF
ncbi:hypothetical protein KUV23_11515 [Algoriphagus marincola]|uniref:Uncharacterized protein n=1 Tax=Algoriphagus marincola TaxID=264027 RepID=A0ABS7N5M9_9BACT|nr:hypothetical protein [Algoriphagus marincola]MBY5951607.1 hypothetical protein [Algoriphagus marincola]